MKRFQYNIILIAIISFMVALFIIEAYNIKSNINITNSRIQDYEIESKREFDYGIKTQVQNVISLLNGIYDKQKKGQLTEKEAKELAKDLVRKLRYGQEGYFWIDTLNAYNLVLPTDKSYEGKSRYNFRDIKGKYVVRELIKNAKKKDGGYTDYYYIKLKSDKNIPKRSYTTVFKPYNWVVGTGSYKDSLNYRINIEKKYYENELRENIINSLIFLLVGLVTSIVLSIYFSRKLYSPVNKIIGLIENATDLEFNKAKDYEKFLKYDDEIGDVINATVIMKKLFSEVVNKFKRTNNIVKELTVECEIEFLVNLDNNIIFVEQELPRIYKNIQDSVLTLSSAVSVLKNKKIVLKDINIDSQDIKQLMDFDIAKSVKQINAISREIQNNILLLNRNNTSKERTKVYRIMSLYSDAIVHNIFNQVQISVKILDSSDKLYAMAKDLNNMPINPNLSMEFYESYIKYIEIIKVGIHQVALSGKGIESSIDGIIEKHFK